MRISWNERFQINNNPEKIKYFYEAYQHGCAEAAVDFICRFCFTFDPRKREDRELPFELFDKQIEYIHWLWDRYENREDGVVDKCRGVGMSWMNAAFSAYLVIFQKAVTVSMYTYKADECHELGNLDTLLEKIIFMIDFLPDLFKQGITHKLMQVKNTRNGSIVVGKSGDSPGRGGRSTMYFLDECAFYPRADSIEAAVSRNADCKIWGSTHHGTATLFYRKATSGINPVFVIDWWEIPMYNQEWYNAEREKAEAEGTMHIFQQEVERNAAASLESVCVPPEWVAAAKRSDSRLLGRKIASLDPANEGGDTHGFVVMDGNCIVYADESGEGDPGDATDKYFWKAHELGCAEFRYDPVGVGVGVAQRLKEILKLPKDGGDLPEDHPVRKMTIMPWNAGGSVQRPTDYDYAEKMNKEFFENAKAQAWWSVREQFLNTHRFVNGKEYKPDLILSFPETLTRKIEKLILEISQPQYVLSKAGKTMIDKKPKGTKSPNLADAFIICRAEIEPEWVPWAG